ncbi:MAG: MFS transporter [Chloroflexota bacterium]
MTAVGIPNQPWRRPPRRRSLEDRNIRFFFVDTAFHGLISGGIITFLPIFIVRLGASSLLVSLLTSLPAIIVALFSIPAGLFVERQRNLMGITNWGRLAYRVFFLVVAIIPFFVGQQRLAAIIVVLMAIQAIPGAVITLSWTAVVAEVIPPRRRPSVNGSRWALVSLVNAVAVAGFGYLLERLDFPIGYQIVFAISFVGGLFSIYFFARMRLPADPPPPPAQPGTLGARLRGYAQVFAETPIFARYLLTTSVLRFGLALPAALYGIFWVRHLDATDVMIGWQATAGSLALIVGYYVWGRVAARQGHHLVLMICTVGAGLYPVLTGLVPAPIWLPLVALVRGLAITGIDISFFDTLLQVCPPENRASFIALDTIVANTAIFLAPMAGSLLADWLGVRFVFFMAGGLHLLAAGLFRLFRVAEDEMAAEQG